jgi:hypothetical protein
MELLEKLFREVDGTSCWIHLVKPWICGLSSILHCRKNGPSEKWAVGVMDCRSNGLSELWAVGIMLRILEAEAMNSMRVERDPSQNVPQSKVKFIPCLFITV